MKFYYEGKLVRTSKTHHYTHALVNVETGKAITCSAKGPEACESYKQSYLRNVMQSITDEKTIIEAVKEGRNGVFLGSKATYYKLRELFTTDIDKLTEFIEENRKRFDRVSENWKVVPLTERA